MQIVHANDLHTTYTATGGGIFGEQPPLRESLFGVICQGAARAGQETLDQPNWPAPAFPWAANVPGGGLRLMDNLSAPAALHQPTCRRQTNGLPGQGRRQNATVNNVARSVNNSSRRRRRRHLGKPAIGGHPSGGNNPEPLDECGFKRRWLLALSEPCSESSRENINLAGFVSADAERTSSRPVRPT